METDNKRQLYTLSGQSCPQPDSASGKNPNDASNVQFSGFAPSYKPTNEASAAVIDCDADFIVWDDAIIPENTFDECDEFKECLKKIVVPDASSIEKVKCPLTLTNLSINIILKKPAKSAGYKKLYIFGTDSQGYAQDGYFLIKVDQGSYTGNAKKLLIPIGDFKVSTKPRPS